MNTLRRRQPASRIALAILVALSMMNPAWAAGWPKRRSAPCTVCPPATTHIITPAEPAKPDAAVTPAPMPSPEEVPAADQPSIDFDLASGTDVASSGPTIAPNMIGDSFSGGGGGLSGPSTVAVYVRTESFPAFSNPFTPNLPLSPDAPVSFSGQTGGVLNLPFTLTSTQVNANINTANPIPLNESPEVTQSVAAEVNHLNPNETAVFFSNDATLYYGGHSGGPVQDGQYFNLNFEYGIFEQMVVDLPSSGSLLVGRIKVAENNSPIPQDRVYVTYNYFNSVPLSASGVNVNRVMPGFEKTFFNRMTSVEVRFPFASTLDNNILADSLSDGYATEYGNMSIILKALLYGSERLYVAAGMGIGVPTGPDLNVGLTGGPQLLQVNNQAFNLQPYFGLLWMPNDYFFAQTFGQLDFGINGNNVYGNLGPLGMQKIGSLNDANLSYISQQIGVWLWKNPNDGWLNAIAPLVEMHYSASINDPDILASNGFIVGDFNDASMLNVTGGLNIAMFNRGSLLLGCVAPLLQQPDRQFNYELSAMFNYYFGPVSRPIPATSF